MRVPLNGFISAFALSMSSSSNNNPPPSATPDGPPPCSASVFIATSKDGYIADSNNSVDWLNELQQSHPLPDGDDGGFGNFMSSVDAIVMGRTTYDTVLGFMDGGVVDEWPYGSKPVYVYTKNIENVKIPSRIQDTVKAVTGTPREALDIVASEIGAQDVYVDGGATIRSFLEAGLVKRAIITVVPVSLGDGVPLFSDEQKKMLQEVSRTQMSNGFIKTVYSIK